MAEQSHLKPILVGTLAAMTSYMKALWQKNSTTVKVHTEGCSMLNAKGQSAVVLDMGEVEDLRERGYKIVVCKCIKKEDKHEQSRR